LQANEWNQISGQDKFSMKVKNQNSSVMTNVADRNTVLHFLVAATVQYNLDLLSKIQITTIRTFKNADTSVNTTHLREKSINQWSYSETPQLLSFIYIYT